MYTTKQIYVDSTGSGLFGIKTAGNIWEQTKEMTKTNGEAVIFIKL